MMTTHTLKYPTRDEDRRRVCAMMLGTTSKQTNKFTIEELESIAVKRGYLKQTIKNAKNKGVDEFVKKEAVEQMQFLRKTCKKLDKNKKKAKK